MAAAALDEIRGLHLLYVKESAAAAAAGAPAPAAGAPAPAAGAPAAAAGAPAPAAGAADLPELYLGEDNKLYGIDGTQLVRMNVDGGNLVRVADAAAHVEKKDEDEDVIDSKEYKSAETAAVRHARRALTDLQGRFPMIENIGDLRARLEECCRGIGAGPGAAPGAGPGAAPGAPKEGSVNVIKILTDDINDVILGNIFNLHTDIKKELIKIFDMVIDLSGGKVVDEDDKRKVFNDTNQILTNLNNYFHECNATLGIGYKIMNGNEDFRKLLDKLDKSIQLGVIFYEACRKFMNAVWGIIQNNDYHYFDTLEKKFSEAIDLHSKYIEVNQYEDNAEVTEDAVKAAYTAIKYEEEVGAGGGAGEDDEEGKEEEEEEEEQEEEEEEEENANNNASSASGGTEEGKEEENSNNASSASGGTEEEENSNNASVGSGANLAAEADAMINKYGVPAAAAPNPRKPQVGGVRNRRVTPIGKKIGGISIKKRTPKKKSRSKK